MSNEKMNTSLTLTLT